MIQTHSTRRLDENDRVTTNGIEPGLTLRDIRFAVQLENLLHSPNNQIARVSDSTHYSTDRDVAWKNLLSEYPFRALPVEPEPTTDSKDSKNSDNSDNSDSPDSSESPESPKSSDILETLSMLARQ